MEKGYWESQGMIWEEGEVPKCSYCGMPASEKELYEAAYSGVLCCIDSECALQYVLEGSPVEYVENEVDEQ